MKWDRGVPASIPDSTPILTDFPSSKSPVSLQVHPSSVNEKKRNLEYGIDALDIDYTNQKSHVEKGRQMVDFEQEGSCSICSAVLEHDEGLYTTCPTQECKAITHLTCLSKHFLDNEDGDAMLPTSGSCPKCKEQMRWVDVVKELTLRLRGQKEVEKLLKVKRARKKGVTTSQALTEDSDEDDEAKYKKLEEEVRRLQRLNPELGDSYLEYEASDDSDTCSFVSNASQKPSLSEGRTNTTKQRRTLDAVVEDSEWDDAEVLDSS